MTPPPLFPLVWVRGVSQSHPRVSPGPPRHLPAVSPGASPRHRPAVQVPAGGRHCNAALQGLGLSFFLSFGSLFFFLIYIYHFPPFRIMRWHLVCVGGWKWLPCPFPCPVPCSVPGQARDNQALVHPTNTQCHSSLYPNMGLFVWGWSQSCPCRGAQMCREGCAPGKSPPAG